MPDMTDGYRDAIANHGASLITHIGLVDNTATELSGGDPAYARLAVPWTTAPTSGVGIVRPSADLMFDIPAAANVSGWRGYSAVTAGTNYGGKALDREEFAKQGQYRLQAVLTGILHTIPA